MAVSTNQRRTDNILSSQRYIDLHKSILMLEPESAPLTTFLSSVYGGGRRERAEDPLFKWHNYARPSRWDAVNNSGGYNSSATSIVVDNGDLVGQEWLLKVPRTGEVMLVTAISTNTLTVVRGYGTTSGAAVNDDEPILFIGTAAEEGDTSLPPRSLNPTLVSNYCQLFKDALAESNTALSSSNMSTPHDWVFQNKATMIEHQISKEYAFLFGEPSERTGPGGSAKTRTTGGLLYFLTSNNQDAGGTLTEAEFETWIRSITRYGSKNKYVFVSRLVASVLNAFSSAKLQTSVGDTVYGVNVTKWQSVHGIVNLVTHDLLEGATYGGMAIAVDFKAEQNPIAYKYLNGAGPGGSRDTHVVPNIQENDRDGRKDEVRAECGLRMGLPQVGGVLTGTTG